jgi:hypothetical protein
LVQLEDVRRLLDESEVPICLQGPELRHAEEAELAGVGLASPFKYLRDDWILGTRVSGPAPLCDGCGQLFVQVGHEVRQDGMVAR